MTDPPRYAQDADIVSRYVAGQPQSDIARTLGLTRERVRQRLKRNGLEGRNYRWIPSRDTIIQALADATSTQELLRRLELSESRLAAAVDARQVGAEYDAALARWREDAREQHYLARQRPLVAQIRAFALRLRHTPSQDELQTIPIYHVDLNRIFGSVPKAMIAAGLIPNQRGRAPAPLPAGFEEDETPTADIDELYSRAQRLRLRSEHLEEPRGSQEPRKVERASTTYYRDPAVVAWVLQTADGFCEACGQQGYQTDTGLHYLEVHHVIPLAERGPDTIANAVAVCETCHGKLHRWRARVQLKATLYERVPRLRPSSNG